MVTTGTEDYYQARALEYDRIYDRPERQGDLRQLRAWLAGQLAGKRVLELAAGTGYWTDVYADGAACVVATDVSEAPLSLARARRRWPETVSFTWADAFSLAGVGGEFDTVFAGFFWSHVPLERLGGLLAAIAGRLRQIGTLIVMDNRHVAGSSHAISRTDAQGNTYQQRRLSDGSQWEVLKNFPTADQLRAQLAPISRSVDVTELDYYWTAVCELPEV